MQTDDRLIFEAYKSSTNLSGWITPTGEYLPYDGDHEQTLNNDLVDKGVKDIENFDPYANGYTHLQQNGSLLLIYCRNDKLNLVLKWLKTQNTVDKAYIEVYNSKGTVVKELDYPECLSESYTEHNLIRACSACEKEFNVTPHPNTSHTLCRRHLILFYEELLSHTTDPIRKEKVNKMIQELKERPEESFAPDLAKQHLKESTNYQWKCPTCKYVFNPLKISEAGMGWIKCLKCKGPVDQKYELTESTQHNFLGQPVFKQNYSEPWIEQKGGVPAIRVIPTGQVYIGTSPIHYDEIKRKIRNVKNIETGFVKQGIFYKSVKVEPKEKELKLPGWALGVSSTQPDNFTKDNQNLKYV